MVWSIRFMSVARIATLNSRAAQGLKKRGGATVAGACPAVITLYELNLNRAGDRGINRVPCAERIFIRHRMPGFNDGELWVVE